MNIRRKLQRKPMVLNPDIEQLLVGLREELGDLGSLTDEMIAEYRSHFESAYAHASETGLPLEIAEMRLIARFGVPRATIALEQATLRRRLLSSTLSSSINIACTILLSLLAAMAILQFAPHDPLRGWEVGALPQATDVSLATAFASFLAVAVCGISAAVLQYMSLSRTAFIEVSRWLKIAVNVVATTTVAIMATAAGMFDIALAAHHSSLGVAVAFTLGWMMTGTLLSIALMRLGWAVGQASRLRSYLSD